MVRRKKILFTRCDTLVAVVDFHFTKYIEDIKRPKPQTKHTLEIILPDPYQKIDLK